MDIRLVLSRFWYLVVGAAAAFFATGTAIGALASGCRIAFRQEDMGQPDPLAGGCVQFVDPVMVAAGVLLAALSLAAAAWVVSRGDLRRAMARTGMVAGLLGSFAPLGLVASLAAYYRLGPVEIAWIALPALLPAAAGVVAALILWRRGSAGPQSAEPLAVSAQGA